jgi:hypothetical protein
MRQWIARVAAGLLALCFGFCGTLHAAPQTGWWWNPDESGRGFFVESHDGITFIGAYLYDLDGHAAWYVAGGTNADSYNYTGALYTMSGGQTLFGGYVPAIGPNNVGTITVHFSDDTHGTLTWPGGTVRIEREIFGTGDAAFQPDNGWWWNPEESGSGYSMEVQGGNLFVVGFMYDDSGRPVWYFSAGPMSSPTTYHGDVLQFARGQTMGGAYHPPGPPTKIATLDIEFTAQDEAEVTFTGVAAAVEAARVKTGGSRSNKWKPQFPKPPRFVYPQRYVTYFAITSTVANSEGTVQWAMDSIENATLDPGTRYTGPPLGPRQDYVLRSGYHFRLMLTGGLAGCSETGSTDLVLPVDAVKLSVSAYSRYTVTFSFPATVVTGVIRCPGADPVTLPVPFPGLTFTTTAAIPNVDITGVITQAGRISRRSVVDFGGGSKVDMEYAFVPVN